MTFTIYSSPISPRYRELIVTDFEDPDTTLRSGLLTETDAKDLAARLREVADQLERGTPPVNMTVLGRTRDELDAGFAVFSAEVERERSEWREIQREAS